MEDKKPAAIHKYKVQSRLIFYLSKYVNHTFLHIARPKVLLVYLALMFASNLEDLKRAKRSY